MIKQALKRFLDEGVTGRDLLALACLAAPGIVLSILINVIAAIVR